MFTEWPCIIDFNPKKEQNKKDRTCTGNANHRKWWTTCIFLQQRWSTRKNCAKLRHSIVHGSMYKVHSSCKHLLTRKITYCVRQENLSIMRRSRDGCYNLQNGHVRINFDVRHAIFPNSPLRTGNQFRSI